MERPRGVNYIKTGGGSALCTYSEKKNFMARFGTQGLYERFLIRNLNKV